jgi:acetyl-CoA carboxylase biotin carboxyl carrier protein
VAEKKINDDGPQARPGQQLEGNEQVDRGGRGRRRNRNRPGPGTSINMDELRELIALIRENGLAEFELEHQGFRVRLRREEASRAATDGEREFTPAEASIVEAAEAVATKSASVQTKNPAVPVHPGAQAETAASEDQDLHIITSPIVGTFYRSPSPTAESFVRIGSTVEAETVVCIIEAMKLMNEIQAETAGEVAKIYVENGQPVEYGQPLFGIKR